MANLTGTQKKKRNQFIALLIAIVVVIAAIFYVAYSAFMAKSAFLASEEYAQLVATIEAVLADQELLSANLTMIQETIRTFAAGTTAKNTALSGVAPSAKAPS